MLCLQLLKGVSVRNLDEFTIEPGPGLNFFYGENASGKTSVLESIFLLSRVKSFRSKRINEIVTYGNKTLTVFAKGKNQSGLFTMGLEKGFGVTRLKFNTESLQTASEQAKKLPVFILTPEHYLLFSGTPKDRRHWLDWSLFHVEQNYLSIWKNYYRALRHRNALLKGLRGAGAEQIEGWEKMMVEEALKIDAARESYITRLNQCINNDVLNKVLSGEGKISYRSAGYTEENLLVALQARRQEDAKRGFTSAGPHRAEVLFELGEYVVAKHLSRGQLKLFSAALLASQVAHLKSVGLDSIVLVDDIEAELDESSSNKMLHLLLSLKTQLFVSSLNKKAGMREIEIDYELFHVEHGQVQKVLQ